MALPASPSSTPTTLFRLTLPIFVENVLRLLTSVIDVVMVSSVSDNAVAAVGVANQYVVLAIAFFQFLCVGGSVLLTHSLGAGDIAGSRATARTVVASSVWIGIGLSLGVGLGAGPLLGFMQTPAELYVYAQPYLVILAGGLWLIAHNTAVSALLRAHGHTADSMWITLAQNGVNAVGNAILLFGLFGAPRMGVEGVAWATLFSRVVAAIALRRALRRHTGESLPWTSLGQIAWKHLRPIIRIGLPSAGEHLSWWLAFMVTTSFAARLGATQLAVQSYTFQIMHIVMAFSLAIAVGNEILVGRLVGAGQFEEAHRRALRSLRAGLLIVAAVVVPIALAGPWMLRWFSDDPAVVAIGSVLLRLAILVELGRVFNLVLVTSLRAVGNPRFPFVLGLLGMWGLWVPLAWALGLHWGYGMVGLWIALIADEWSRGLILLRRWRSRRWLPFAERSRRDATQNLPTQPVEAA